MKLTEIRNRFKSELSTIYDEKEIESFFYIILESFHCLKRIDLAMQPDLEVDKEQLDRWGSVLSDLKMCKPIQYILEEAHFYGLNFKVNENVLIPRPETEELVEWIISQNKDTVNAASLTLLDIGTGSGCIPIALAKHIPNAIVHSIDVSEKALEVAKRNAVMHHADVKFIHQDILETENLPVKYDIIVSNPPYVRNLEKTEINKNVLDYEPHLALFVADDDALLFYRKIAQLAQKSLTEKGQLYFEINQYLGNQMVELLESLGFKNIELRKDVYGNDRMISCTL
jgi:release factor glutamine methyltransferase